jgi:hypothetical protein
MKAAAAFPGKLAVRAMLKWDSVDEIGSAFSRAAKAPGQGWDAR